MRKVFVILFFLLAVSTVSAQSNVPQIVRFDADVMQVNRADLVAGTARIPVSWEVIHRNPLMNLVFEQVLPDGSIVNVELPRNNPWVNSNEVGVVAPRDPGSAVTEIHLQVRLYYFFTTQTLDTATLTIRIVDTVSSPDLGPDPAGVTINSFDVTPMNATGGDTLTISWDVSGVQSIELSVLHIGNSRMPTINSYANVGTVSVSAPQGVRTARVWLRASEDLQETITLSLDCQIAWFYADAFAESCPAENTQFISTTYQSFEHGYVLQRANNNMLWYYLYSTGTFSVIPLNLPHDTEPFSETTPAGLYLPSGDIGNLWTGSAYMRTQLGWATAPAQNYSMQYQESLWGLGTRIRKDRLFTLPDATVIRAAIEEF